MLTHSKGSANVQHTLTQQLGNYRSLKTDWAIVIAFLRKLGGSKAFPPSLLEISWENHNWNFAHKAL